MGWFSNPFGGTGNGHLDETTQNGFQLDIVGFLAILGEGSVETIAQVATLSNLVYLPRLIPAPQIFIRPSRPDKLETTAEAEVIGIKSGNSGTAIHHVAHALHRGDKLKPNTVQCVRISEDDTKPRPSIRRFGPLALLSILGFVMSAGLFASSARAHDAFGLGATISLSILSTITGVANKWSPSPNSPKPDPHSPPADVVIKYPQGAFIVVKCEEITARYLYFNPSERCVYKVASTTLYRGLSLISTLLLMSGVICLANSKLEMQIAFAGSYMTINVFYWIGAALPPARHWDLSRLNVEIIEVHGGTPPRTAMEVGGDASSPAKFLPDAPPTYTEALWKAIAVTGSKNWVKEAGWAPKTDAWEEWLHEAEDAAIQEPMKITLEKTDEGTKEIWRIRNWDSRKALSTLLKPTSSAKV